MHKSSTTVLCEGRQEDLHGNVVKTASSSATGSSTATNISDAILLSLENLIPYTNTVCNNALGTNANTENNFTVSTVSTTSFENTIESPLVVALLNLSYQLDANISNTLQYYFTNFPFMYQPFPIVNTGYNLENTLNALNKYYYLGVRYFVLTTHSSILYELLEWFQQHPNVTGWSGYAQSNIWKIPKQFYTMTPLFKEKFSLYSNTCIIPYDVIYYLYPPSETASVSLLLYLETTCKSLGKKFVPLNSLNVTDDFTPENVNNMMKTIKPGENASIILCYGPLSQLFYNCFYNTTYYTGYIFYETAVYPTFTNKESAKYFNNTLYITSSSQSNLSASYLWKLGYQNAIFPSDVNYGSPVLNILDMINGSIKNIIVSKNSPAQSDSSSFNLVNKTCNGFSFPVLRFTFVDDTSIFTPIIVYYKNQVDEIFQSIIQNYSYTPVSITSIFPPLGPVKKCAALLELPSINYKTLEYLYTTTGNQFVQMPVYDTKKKLEITIQLLQELYDNGTRIFLGFSRSTILKGVLPWFESHPDAIGISSGSSADSLKIKKNIYRLQIVDSYALESINEQLTTTIEKNGRIFYVYSDNEVGSTSVLYILQTKYGNKNIIPYPVLFDKSNLNVNDLNNFYISNSINDKDIVIVYLLINGQISTYIDLFDSSIQSDPLNLNVDQYDILLNGFPVINSNSTTLKNHYNVLAVENITTSALWNNCATYLGTSFSSNALNALQMATELANNKSVYSLASYNGCLQFDQYNDIKYGSISNYLYDQNGEYKISYIYCTDPLYGQLNFTPLKTL